MTNRPACAADSTDSSSRPDGSIMGPRRTGRALQRSVVRIGHGEDDLGSPLHRRDQVSILEPGHDRLAATGFGERKYHDDCPRGPDHPASFAGIQDRGIHRVALKKMKRRGVPVVLRIAVAVSLT